MGEVVDTFKERIGALKTQGRGGEEEGWDKKEWDGVLEGDYFCIKENLVEEAHNF